MSNKPYSKSYDPEAHVLFGACVHEPNHMQCECFYAANHFWDKYQHARFMAAGWKRLARISQQPRPEGDTRDEQALP